MIQLKNIKINGTQISCEIIPEDSAEKGYIVVDIKTGEIIDYSLPPGYDWCKNHINHARLALLKMSKSKDIPKDKLLMWY